MKRLMCCAGLLVMMSTTGAAQWAKYLDPDVPVDRGNRPLLTARTPRLNGKPDLSGVWLNVLDPLPPGRLAVEGSESSGHPRRGDSGNGRLHEPGTGEG
jgi:hypothetical protein